MALFLWPSEGAPVLRGRAFFWRSAPGLITFLVSALTILSTFGQRTILFPVLILFFPPPTAAAAAVVVRRLNNLGKLALVGRHADNCIVGVSDCRQCPPVSG
jgi:hypothetical protein